MPLLRRNGGSFPELTVPQFSIPTPFHISCSHMSYRHNLYHLTHVTTEHAVQMRHFKMSNGVSPKTHFQGKTFPWRLALAGHHTWSSYSVYPWHIHQIAKQSIITWYYNPNWSFHNQAMTLAIKFIRNLQFYLLQKLTCSIVGLL